MVKVSVRQLEKDCYRLEGECYSRGDFVRYYLVTNVDSFKTRLRSWFEERKRILEWAKEIESLRRIKFRECEILKAFERLGEEKYVRVEGIGFNPKRGLVDLIEIPVVEGSHNIETVFERKVTPLVLFRIFYPPKDEQIDRPRWTGNLTDVDLEYMAMLGEITQPPELTLMQNIFSEAMGGSDLTMIKKLLIRKESNLGLRRLREAAEYTLLTLIKNHYLEIGDNFEEPLQKRAYAFQAKELGLLSSSDFAQTGAFMYAGNAAVHHDFLRYSQKNAILFLDWLTDFVQRTIGIHMMPKSRDNGTSFSDGYELTTDGEGYRLRRALFDQLHTINLIEREKSPYRDFLHLENGTESKETVMASAIKILRKIQTIKELRFSNADLYILEAINFWERSINSKSYDFTARDAARAAFFSGETFFVSKEIDEERLMPRSKRDTYDVNQLQWVRKKGMTISRYRKYGFDGFRKELDTDLELVIKTIDSYFPDFKIVLDKKRDDKNVDQSMYSSNYGE